MEGIIIVGLIALYASYVIYKKVKEMKNGKFCGCGCSGCPSSKSCHKN